MADVLEGDLMDAMNAALLLEDDASASENLGSLSGHSSLRSVDVMDEAMDLLLSGDSENVKDGEDFDIDGDEEEIDFANFLAPAPTKPKQGEDLKTTSDEERCCDNSPTSVIDAAAPVNGETEECGAIEASAKVSPKNSKTSPRLKKKASLRHEQPQVVPLKQFENALALIQDLENRIQVLETDQQCVLEENEQLKDTINKQATSMADMESKLERFPKLLEQTVQEEARLSAKQAETEAKLSFWRKDIARQEQEKVEEQLKKNRVGKHVATTGSLKQSDFLEEIVELKEKEAVPAAVVHRGPVAIFKGIRGWAGNRINGGNNNKNTNNHLDGSQKDASARSLPDEGFDSGTSAELVTSESHDSASIQQNMDFDEDVASSETNNGIEDNGKDSKVLDLMT